MDRQFVGLWSAMGLGFGSCQHDRVEKFYRGHPPIGPAEGAAHVDGEARAVNMGGGLGG